MTRSAFVIEPGEAGARQSVSDRDRMVQNGMESDAPETIDRVEELLAAARV